MASPGKSRQIPYSMKFVLGGLSGMSATSIVQPLDLVKNRMQLSGLGTQKKEYKSSFHCLRTVIAKEGVLAVYKGIGAGLLRQATYTTGRMGVYTSLLEKYKSLYPGNPQFLALMAMGVIAGACGAFFGTPAEVVLIRMTADGRLPKEQRRNYKNVVNALMRITKEEGVTTLWRGCIPTVFRAMVVNMAQLATYSQAKSLFIEYLDMTEGLALHLVASMFSGLVTTTASMPVDILKTRIQNMKYIDGKPEYSGSLDVLVKILKKEGFFSMWKGFTPYLFRLGPHTVLCFIFLEKYSNWYYKYILKAEGGSTF